MAWAVTYDHLEDRARLFGRYKAEDRRELRYAFRLYDDDDNLCYSGVSSDRDSEKAFAPLDYCTEAYGCTRIDYLQDDDETWETL